MSYRNTPPTYAALLNTRGYCYDQTDTVDGLPTDQWVPPTTSPTKVLWVVVRRDGHWMTTEGEGDTLTALRINLDAAH